MFHIWISENAEKENKTLVLESLVKSIYEFFEWFLTRLEISSPWISSHSVEYFTGILNFITWLNLEAVIE